MKSSSKDVFEKIRSKSLVRYFALSAHVIDQRIQEQFRADGIQLPARHAAILPLIDLDGTRLTEVARRSGLSKQAMSRHVRELQKSGYLSQTPDPDDRRATLLIFTLQGRQLLKSLHESLQIVERNLAKELAASNYRNTCNAMKRIALLPH